MAVVLTYGAGVPVVKVGRIAGQFAKPRSSPTERVGDVELETFRGHMVNDDAPDAERPGPRPDRLIAAYHQSASTLNLVRAFTKGGFADLSQVHLWNQQFVASSDEGRRYEQIAGEIDRALRFMAACGIDLDSEESLHQVDFYTSHEALILGYEEALTRQDSLTGDFYDCSAHMLWVGERTRQLDGAHLEFLSGIHNPIGCKVGPSTTPDEVGRAVRAPEPRPDPGPPDPDHPDGRRRVADALPPLLEAVRDAGHPVVWACDPMHGNTFVSDGGRKTRRFDDILARAPGLLRRPPPGGHVARRRARRADRRRRHRMPGRVRRHRRGPAARALHDDVRSPPQRPPGHRSRVPRGRAAAGLTAGAHGPSHRRDPPGARVGAGRRPCAGASLLASCTP